MISCTTLKYFHRKLQFHKSALIRNYIFSTYTPSTSCKISKKTDESILKKNSHNKRTHKSGHFGPFWPIFG